MVKENGMVMMTEQEHDLELDIICKDYEEKQHILKKEHNEEIKTLTRRIELLQTAITELIHNTNHGSHDVRVSRTDFLEMYQKALDEFFDNMEKPNCDELPNDIYGKDFFVHWNGIYCNCGDGAAISNYLIPGIEGINEEDNYEY